jgi:iron complex outermembrane receptor protein
VNRALIVAALAVVVASGPGVAQPVPASAPGTLSITLPSLDIIAAPLLPGVIDLDKVPASSQVFHRGDVSRAGYPSVLRVLDEGAAGVTLDQGQGNPWQPNLLFHGFDASPLVGNAQGLAVYVNGSRFNQPFGDTTNWDLIPDIAIDDIELVGPIPHLASTHWAARCRSA